MATVSLSSAFNTNDFWSARTGAAITNNGTTYEFQNAAGFYVRVTGTSLTYTGDDPLGGNYTAIDVYSDAGFTTAVAAYDSLVNVAFGSFFGEGARTALAGDDIFNTPSGFAVTLNGQAGDDTFEITRGNLTIADFVARYFTAVLSEANETTPTGSAATGTANIVLNGAATRLTLSLTSTGLDFDGAQTGTANDNVTGFHIHNADAGVNGDIVWNIGSDADTVTNAAAGTATSAWTGVDLASNLADLLADGLYVNIHTTLNPGGDVRGQVDEAAGGSADLIDLTLFNIGTLAAWRAVTADVAGSARMATFLGGVVSTLTVTGMTEALFTGADFVFAGSVVDVLNGGGLADDLFGAGGNDTLRGFGGNDRLFGENGADSLTGGAGRDIMSGGTSGDDFDFNNVAEIGKTAATRDRISDFTHTIDDIDLSTIDANGAAPGHTFTFLAGKGAAFTGAKGQLRWFQVNPGGTANDKTIVEGDINGNKVLDFAIELSGLKTLTGADFML